MITIAEILDLIDAYNQANGKTDAEISRSATNSPDTIRNWRRRLEKGELVGANATTLQAVAEVIGVNIVTDRDPGPPIRGEAEILAMLKRIEGLNQRGIELAMMAITTSLEASRATKSAQIDADDQSSSPTHRHAS